MTYVSTKVAFWIIQISQKERATSEAAINTQNEDSAENHPGTMILSSFLSCAKNTASTWALDLDFVFCNKVETLCEKLSAEAFCDEEWVY